MSDELLEFKNKLDNNEFTAEWYLNLEPYDKMVFHMKLVHLECEDRDKYSLNKILSSLNKQTSKREYVLHDKRNNTFSKPYSTYDELKETLKLNELKKNSKGKFSQYFKVLKNEYKLQGNDYVKY
jgi:hypothetical protein